MEAVFIAKSLEFWICGYLWIELLSLVCYLRIALLFFSSALTVKL